MDTWVLHQASNAGWYCRRVNEHLVGEQVACHTQAKSIVSKNFTSFLCLVTATQKPRKGGGISQALPPAGTHDSYVHNLQESLGKSHTPCANVGGMYVPYFETALSKPFFSHPCFSAFEGIVQRVGVLCPLPFRRD